LYFDLLPILVVLFFYKKIKSQPIWVLFVYSIYSFGNNLLILYFTTYRPTYDFNKFVFFFTLFEYLFFAATLYFILKSQVVKKTLLFISPLFAIFCVYFIFWGAIKRFDSLQTSIECIIIIVICLYYFYEQLMSPEVELIYTSYKFWIIIGLLLYLAGSFFIFVFAADMPKKESDNYWPILFVCGIIRNILFAIAVYLSTRPQDEEPYQSLI
jgi:hypothetical protein